MFKRIDKDLVDFILQAYLKGFISRKTQNVYSGMTYYTKTWELKKLGIIEELDYYGDKRWVLTEKGKKLAKILLELRKNNFI